LSIEINSGGEFLKAQTAGYAPQAISLMGSPNYAVS